MSIRAKLIIWFLVAALVPAAAIALFVTNDASERFVTQARDELREARKRGIDQIAEVKNTVRLSVSGVIQSGPMQDYLESLDITDTLLVDATLTQRISESLESRLDFIKILDSSGSVLSSLEWLVFAGKTDLEWDQLGNVEPDTFVIGPVPTDQESMLGIRYLTTISDLMVVGGITLGERDLNRFGAAKDITSCLYDGVSHQIITNERLNGLNEDILVNEIISSSSSETITIGSQRYLVSYFPLNDKKPETAAVVFFYSTAPLNEEISSLWRSFMVTAAVGVILATLLGVFVSATVSRPLNKLLYGFELVSLGDFTHRLHTSRRDELGGILRSFNDTTDNLRSLQNQLLRSERVAAWQEIARKIAHEIKNPLSPIQISIETMRKVYDRKHPDFEKIFRESSSTIIEEVDKIRAIVQEFSDFARMPEPHFEEVSIQAILKHIITLYQHQDESVVWNVEIPEELPPVFADEKQLQRASMNLIKNALESMNSGGTITITANYQPPMITTKRGARRAGKIHVHIQDTGMGISPEDQARVFTPYFTTKETGTGLGLVIVQKIIELHKGGLSLSSAQNEGTRVEITLPEFVG